MTWQMLGQPCNAKARWKKHSVLVLALSLTRVRWFDVLLCQL
jgi:hypothetical protein